MRQSKFRHVYCKPVKHEQCISDVRITEITWDSLFCAVNPKFIAIITKGSGGPFQVIPVTKVSFKRCYEFISLRSFAFKISLITFSAIFYSLLFVFYFILLLLLFFLAVLYFSSLC